MLPSLLSMTYFHYSLETNRVVSKLEKDSIKYHHSNAQLKGSKVKRWTGLRSWTQKAKDAAHKMKYQKVILMGLNLEKLVSI